jgi:hypothetical protein
VNERLERDNPAIARLLVLVKFLLDCITSFLDEIILQMKMFNLKIKFKKGLKKSPLKV